MQQSSETDMKVRVILHDSDHSVCCDEDGAFKVEAVTSSLFHNYPVSVVCQHAKPASVQTCELKTPEKTE